MMKHISAGKVREYAWVAVIGAAGYSLLEILWRGHTHWSMTLAGGICLPLIYRVHAGERHCLAVRSVICSGIITTVEFAVGVVVNLLLGWQVWDYSAQPGNILGQICPLFCFLWFLLSLPILLLCGWLRHHMEPELPRQGGLCWR